jgi:hypothetical protein
MTKTEYTPELEDAVLNEYLRPRRTEPADSVIARIIGPDVSDVAARSLLWKLFTGHDCSEEGPNGKVPRREYAPTEARERREGAPWLTWETKWLKEAMDDYSHKRDPAIDITYMAAILARSEGEVRAKWRDTSGGVGFGFDRRKNEVFQDD